MAKIVKDARLTIDKFSRKWAWEQINQVFADQDAILGKGSGVIAH
jgi:hypothetical protein